MDLDQFQSTTARVRGQHRAFTIVELLLALLITALVSGGVAGMLMAVSYGTSSRRDLRSAVVQRRVLDSRIGSSIRHSRAILESGVDYFVLWIGDTNPNGTADAPDLSEIRLIERDAVADNLNKYEFPDTWTQVQIDAADVAYSLTGNPAGFFLAATAAAKTAGSFVPELWATGVTSATYVLDGATPDVTTLVSYRLTLSAGDLSETFIGSAATRYGASNPG